MNHATPSLAIGAPVPTNLTTGAGIWMGKDTIGGNYDFRVGDPAGHRIWDGSTGTLTIVGDGDGITNIDGGNIQTGTVTATQIASHTLTSDQIYAGAITATEIASHTLTSDQIYAGAITATEIASHTITADQIYASTITATEIAASTITADRLNVSSLSAIAADLGSVTAGSLIVGSTNKLWLNDSGSGELAIGGSTKASAPFYVDATGRFKNGAFFDGNVHIENGAALYVPSLVGADYPYLHVCATANGQLVICP